MAMSSVLCCVSFLLSALRLAGVIAAVASTLLVAKLYVGNGGYVPLPGVRGGYYARRWVSPSGATGEKLQGVMNDLCAATVGVALPHRALHDARFLRDKIIFVVYDKAGVPVMFHMAFRADYVHDLVIHLGLVMVHPEHQGKHLQRVCIYNMMCCCLTYFTFDFIMTDVADSPSNTKLVSDNMAECYPSYRAPARRPQPWQRDVVSFMMEHHREDFGTAEDARLDLDTFVVHGSNGECGGSSVLVQHGAKRRSKTGRVNLFVESLTGGQGTQNEIFHVGRCRIFHWACHNLLRSAPPLKSAVCTTLFLAHIPWMFLWLLLDRIDLLMGVFRSFCKWSGVTIQVQGTPYGNSMTTSINAPLRELGSFSRGGLGGIGAGEPRGKGRQQGSCIWASNHYSWLDYGVLCMVARHMLRALVKQDIAEEGLGGWLLSFVVKRLKCIMYKRGDRSSGDAVRQALTRGLMESSAPIVVFPEGTSQVKGPPMPFRHGSFHVAYVARRPVQPVALWYSEDVGLAPKTDNVGGTSEMFNRNMLAVVHFAPVLHPEDFASAKSFGEAVEKGVRDAYDDISGTRIYSEPV